MAIARMDRLFLLGMRKDQDAIVAALTKLGAVEIQENEAMKAAYLQALCRVSATPDQDIELPQMKSFDEMELLVRQDAKRRSPLLAAEDNLPTEGADSEEIAAWSDNGDEDYGRGEGRSQFGDQSHAARFYFYSLMEHFATSDEEAPSGTYEYMVQSRTHEVLEQTQDPKEEARRAYQFAADLVRPEEIPPLRRLLSNYCAWLSELIPEAMRLTGEKKPLFTLKREVSTQDYAAAGKRQAEIIEAAVGLEQVRSDIEGIRREIEQVHASMHVLEPWKRLRLPAPVHPGEKDWGIRSLTGSLASRDALSQLRDEIHEAELPASIEVLGESNTESVAVLVIYLEHAQQALRELLDDRGFAELPRLTGLQVAPGDYQSAWEKQRDRVRRLEEELEVRRAEGKEFAQYKEDFEVLHDFYEVQDKKLEAMQSVLQTDHIFVVSGYLPTALSGPISKALTDRYNIIVELSETEADEDFPILLQNHKLVRPFEAVMRTFSMPRPGHDVDPSPVMAIFYVIFFGMILGDVGYGLMLSGLMAVLLWKVKVQGNFRDMTMVLFLSGLMSIPFGLLFGGFFGDLVTQVSEGRVHFPTLLLNPLTDPINMLIFSMGAGIIHLFAGLALDIRTKINMGDWQGALFGVAPWYVIITSFVGVLVGLDWAVWGLIGGFAVLILLSSPDRNPLKRILGGLSSITGIADWLSDVLSYARVLALALATSVIAMVVNILAMLPGYKGFSFIFFLVIMAFGHILNLALSGLSAYVHTIRLQYVEFFGKFYEGGGRLFSPLNYETRYTYARRTEERQDQIDRGEFPIIKAPFVRVNSQDESA